MTCPPCHARITTWKGSFERSRRATDGSAGARIGTARMLRYGRRVAYYEAGVRTNEGASSIDARVRQVPRERWRMARVEQRLCQEEQLKQYRVRHRRQQFLAGLEA